MNHKPKRTHWTEYEVNRLQELVDNATPDAEIAVILRRTLASVKGKKAHMGIGSRVNLPTQDPKLVAQIVKFRMAGWRLEKIANAFGVSDKRISNILCANGLGGLFFIQSPKVYPYQFWTESELRRLRKYLKRGYTFKRILTYFPNRTPSAIYQQIGETTRYWLPPKQLSERQHARKKQLRVY